MANPKNTLVPYEHCVQLAEANRDSKFKEVTNYVFWTGDAVEKGLVEHLIKDKLDGNGTWSEAIFPGHAPGESWIRAKQYGPEDFERELVISRASKAYAAISRGTALLLIPLGKSETDPYKERNSHWVFHEYNTLTRNRDINEIYRIDPGNLDDRKKIWTKGDDVVGDEANEDDLMPMK